jgi:hypothetical protein
MQFTSHKERRNTFSLWILQKRCLAAYFYPYAYTYISMCFLFWNDQKPLLLIIQLNYQYFSWHNRRNRMDWLTDELLWNWWWALPFLRSEECFDRINNSQLFKKDPIYCNWNTPLKGVKYFSTWTWHILCNDLNRSIKWLWILTPLGNFNVTAKCTENYSTSFLESNPQDW